MILAKYNPNGNIVWLKKANGTTITTPFGSLNAAGANKIAIDNNGYIYVAGGFTGNGTFDSTTITAFGNTDAFLAKYDNNGTLIWVKNFGGNGTDNVSGLSVDNVGNCYVSGETLAGNAYFPGGVTLTAPNSYFRGFVAKFNTNGLCTWAKRTTTVSYTGGVSYNDNKVYWIGGYNSIFNYDTTTLTENDSIKSAYFYAQLDTAGNIVWIHQELGKNMNFESVSNVNGSVYVTGYYQGSTSIGGITLTAASQDAFLFKVNDSGNFKWVTNLQASTFSGAHDVKANVTGDVYICGEFAGLAMFGSFSVSASASFSAFAAKYDSNGNCKGMRQGTFANGSAITADGNDNCYLGGSFYNTANFDNFSLTSYGDEDMFIARATTITGIGGVERHANNQLIIYANPTAGKCNMTVPDDFLNEKNLSLSIYANDGKLIQQKNVQTSPLEGQGAIKLNLEAEARGVYNVTLSNGVKSYSGKIVFE